MKKRSLMMGITLMGLVAVFVILYTLNASPPAARPVRLVITGPDGQRFSGSYTADGVTNSVSAIAPATLNMQARDVTFEFKRVGGDGEFRVDLYVGDLCRTSTTSAKLPGVRGELRYAATSNKLSGVLGALRYATTSESYWAAGFD
jgi:hypothetical protein